MTLCYNPYYNLYSPDRFHNERTDVKRRMLDPPGMDSCWVLEK